MKPATLLAMLLLLPGCPVPTQYGGPIAVDTSGFAVRMQWLCRWGMQGAKASACLAEAQQGEGDPDGGVTGEQEAPEGPDAPAVLEGPSAEAVSEQGDAGSRDPGLARMARGERWCSGPGAH